MLLKQFYSDDLEFISVKTVEDTELVQNIYLFQKFLEENNYDQISGVITSLIGYFSSYHSLSFNKDTLSLLLILILPVKDISCLRSKCLELICIILHAYEDNCFFNDQILDFLCDCMQYPETKYSLFLFQSLSAFLSLYAYKTAALIDSGNLLSILQLGIRSSIRIEIINIISLLPESYELKAKALELIILNNHKECFKIAFKILDELVDIAFCSDMMYDFIIQSFYSVSNDILEASLSVFMKLLLKIEISPEHLSRMIEITNNPGPISLITKAYQVLAEVVNVYPQSFWEPCIESLINLLYGALEREFVIKENAYKLYKALASRVQLEEEDLIDEYESIT